MTTDEMLEAYGRKRLDDIDYWVYTIECSTFGRDFDDLRRKAEKRLGEEPWWLRLAFEHNRQYYVGQTENLEKRLGQHFKKQNSSEFTQLFEPRRIVRLEPARSRNHAEVREKRIVESYIKSNEVFAYGH